jgi:hypothetical protein
MARIALGALLFASLLLPAQDATVQDDFTCPMDKDVHSSVPGKCPRCGMKLVANLPDPVEYPLNLTMTPAAPKPGDAVQLHFDIRDPKTGKRVTDFETVHEKLFHLFIVSEDLTHFAHQHPSIQPDGTFVYSYRVPQTGEFRILADFFPKGGTPQLIARTVFVPGPRHHAELKADVEPKESTNMSVALRTEPAQPIAGLKTLMFFDLTPSDGLEPYLGAWGHMLAASADLVDMIHNHPAFPEAGPTVQFNLIFPRPGVYRVWVQFQRAGKVNTVAFNVPVRGLE